MRDFFILYLELEKFQIFEFLILRRLFVKWSVGVDFRVVKCDSLKND